MKSAAVLAALFFGSLVLYGLSLVYDAHRSPDEWMPPPAWPDGALQKLDQELKERGLGDLDVR